MNLKLRSAFLEGSVWFRNLSETAEPTSSEHWCTYGFASKHCNIYNHIGCRCQGAGSREGARGCPAVDTVSSRQLRWAHQRTQTSPSVKMVVKSVKADLREEKMVHRQWKVRKKVWETTLRHQGDRWRREGGAPGTRAVTPLHATGERLVEELFMCCPQSATVEQISTLQPLQASMPEQMDIPWSNCSP